MRIEEHVAGGVTVVSLEGQLDAATAPDVDQRLKQLVSDGRRRLVVDLAAVTDMSSAGLWVLQGAIREARASGGDLRLAGLHASTRDVLAQTGFTALFRVFPTVESALVAFSMELQEQVQDGVNVISLSGDLDAASAPAVNQHLQQVIAEGPGRVVLDFDGVSYIASAGLRVLQLGLQQARGKGGDLRLAALRPDVKQVFDLVGFTPLFRIYPDADAAVAAFQG